MDIWLSKSKEYTVIQPYEPHKLSVRYATRIVANRQRCDVFKKNSALKPKKHFTGIHVKFLLSCSTEPKLFYYHYYQVFNKSTPTGNTGPSAAAQGEWYAYMEASNGGHGDFTHLVITHPFKPGKQNYHKRQVSSALKQRHSKVMPLQHRAASCDP